MSRAHSYSHSRAHSPTFPSLHLRHNSFSNPSVALPTSQHILQTFRCFTYHSSFSNHSLASPTSQALQSRAHSPTLPSLYLRHSSFSNLSVASSTSQLILQPFFRFSYVHKLFTYFTWRAAHAGIVRSSSNVSLSSSLYFSRPALE